MNNTAGTDGRNDAAPRDVPGFLKGAFESVYMAMYKKTYDKRMTDGTVIIDEIVTLRNENWLAFSEEERDLFETVIRWGYSERERVQSRSIWMRPRAARRFQKEAKERKLEMQAVSQRARGRPFISNAGGNMIYRDPSAEQRGLSKIPEGHPQALRGNVVVNYGGATFKWSTESAFDMQASAEPGSQSVTVNVTQPGEGKNPTTSEFVFDASRLSNAAAQTPEKRSSSVPTPRSTTPPPHLPRAPADQQSDSTAEKPGGTEVHPSPQSNIAVDPAVLAALLRTLSALPQPATGTSEIDGRGALREIMGRIVQMYPAPGNGEIKR